MKVNKSLKNASVNRTIINCDTHAVRADSCHLSKPTPISEERSAKFNMLAQKVLNDNLEAWKTLAKE